MSAVPLILLALLAWLITQFLKTIITRTFPTWGTRVAITLAGCADWVGRTDGEHLAEVSRLAAEDDRGIAHALGSLASECRRPYVRYRDRPGLARLVTYLYAAAPLLLYAVIYISESIPNSAVYIVFIAQLPELLQSAGSFRKAQVLCRRGYDLGVTKKTWKLPVPLRSTIRGFEVALSDFDEYQEDLMARSRRLKDQHDEEHAALQALEDTSDRVRVIERLHRESHCMVEEFDDAIERMTALHSFGDQVRDWKRTLD